MATRRPRRSSRLNPLNLRPAKPTRGSLPKAAAQVRGKKSNLPWWQKLNPFRKDRPPFVWSWRTFFIWAGAAAAVFLVVTASLFAYYVRDLPNPRKLTERQVSESTKLLDRTGKPLYSFYGEENRTLVTNDQISDYAKQATVALEDANFYHHAGFDVKGLSRAVVCRVASFVCGGRVAGGGSTITQQYIKSALIQSRAQTADRKLRELILAIEIEQIYNKDEILTGYLNEIPYGANAYGIEAAAQTYFNKPAKDLTLSEAATLAAIPQRPTYYSPFGNNQKALFDRKNFVLDRMVKVGYITTAQADEAKKAAPTVDNPTFAARSDLIAPHFIFYVRQQLIDFLGGDQTVAEQQLDQDGFTVTTSIDLETQALGESILKDMGPNVVSKYQASNAALVAVDPKTGEVLAMVGSIDYVNSKSGNTNFATAELQPGSSFKPFVYATEFDPDHKRSPASITYDLSTDFGGGYRPNNYNGNFSGPITNRDALARSLNIPAVKNLYLAGITDSIDTAKRLGITTLDRKSTDYGLSLVLGSGEVKPVEMASAYGTFGNAGMHNTLRPILKIEKNGQVVKDFTQDPATKAVEPEVAFQVNSILSDNSARAPVFGTRNNLVLADRPVAAKSGTTQNNRDAWTVGYTPQISVAVWVGNNEAGKTMVKGADGSIVAAPIWNRFMREYLKGKPTEGFTQPDTIKQFTVDRLSGKLPTDQTPPDGKITDWFAPWQIPTDFDDVHVKVRISKSTGQLATDLTPPEDVEERYYCKVHSEVPDNPNWENPVQDWARSNGCGDNPPTGSDDVHTEGNRPTASITSPTNGSTVSGTFTIAVATGGPRAIAQVQFFINNVSVGTVTQAPWSLNYDSSLLPDGTNVIEVVVKNDIGLTKSDQVSVNKGGGSVLGAVTNITHSAGKFSPPTKAIHIAWVNPNNPGITQAIITQSGPGGNTQHVVNVTPGAAGFIDISGLAIGTYTFTIRVRDSVGNEGPASSPFTEQMLP